MMKVRVRQKALVAALADAASSSHVQLEATRPHQLAVTGPEGDVRYIGRCFYECFTERVGSVTVSANKLLAVLDEWMRWDYVTLLASPVLGGWMLVSNEQTNEAKAIKLASYS